MSSRTCVVASKPCTGSQQHVPSSSAFDVCTVSSKNLDAAALTCRTECFSSANRDIATVAEVSLADGESNIATAAA
jgi:hypothetical protein